jgi:hypothetical protein
MLKKVDFPLNTSQLSQFFVDRNYTDFLTLQQSISSLLENGFITKEVVHNNSQFTLSPAGEEALQMFQYKISDGIQDDVLDFFTENKYKLRNEVEVYSNYVPAADNEYIVECVVKERNSTVLNLKLNVATKDMAVTICDRWKEQSSEVYTYLINQLLLNQTS